MPDRAAYAAPSLGSRRLTTAADYTCQAVADNVKAFGGGAGMDSQLQFHTAPRPPEFQKPELKFRSRRLVTTARRCPFLGRTILTVLRPLNIFLAQSAFLRVWPDRRMHPSSGALAS